MFGIGPVEMGIVLLILGGGVGAVPQVGVPLPPDAALDRTAPAEVLLYVGLGGQGKADAKSANPVEQLTAEPEVQEFFGEVARLIDEGLAKLPARSEEERILAKSLPVVAKTLLSRPAMLYLADVNLPPQPPSANAALVVNAGDEAEALVAALEELEGLYLKQMPPTMSVEESKLGKATLRTLPVPPGAPPASWGRQGSYVFLAVGAGEAKKVAERLAADGAAPQWLTDFRKEAGVPRISGAAYVDLAAVLKKVEPLLDAAAQPGAPVDPRRVIEALGGRHLRHLAVVAGLDDKTGVSKLILAHDGEAQGVVSLLAGKGLQPEHLKKIPRDANLAAVARFDAAAAYDTLLKIAGEIEPRAVERFQAEMAQGEAMLGFHPRNDLLAGLGDTLTLYNSPAEGGLFFTGACAAIGVRDSAKVERVIDRLRRAAEAQQSAERPDFAVRKTTAGEHAIYYVQFLREPIPLAPAWCLTDDELVVAIMPQMVRAHLTRSADAGSLADVEELAQRLSTGDVTGISYVDSKLMFEALYSYANILAIMGAGALEKETGIRADLAKLPSFASVSRHLRPSIGLTRATKNVWSAESYATGPSIGPLSIGMVVPLMLGVRGSHQQSFAAHETKAVVSVPQYVDRPSHQAAPLVPQLEERLEGFVPLFDGRTLDGWIGATDGYEVRGGAIVCSQAKGGNLFTAGQYSDFVLRLEIQIPEGGNNGLGVRSPNEPGNVAYSGIELQVLDDDSPKYATIKPYQHHGSVYGVVPAKAGALKPDGEWNEQEVVVQGNQVKVVLNGRTIVDADLAEVGRNGTPDGKDHPGLKRTTGHIGFLGHGSAVAFRNIRLKDLSRSHERVKP